MTTGGTHPVGGSPVEPTSGPADPSGAGTANTTVETPLPTFSANRRCPKCGSSGGIDISTSYRPANDAYVPGRLDTREHLHRSCRRCRYAWAEAPLDARRAL